MAANTTTPIGGWMKAVFMQEGNLPTVADCCRLAALVEHGVRAKDEPHLPPADLETLRFAADQFERIFKPDGDNVVGKLRAIIARLEGKA